jgi:hypothetical protein
LPAQLSGASVPNPGCHPIGLSEDF